MPVSNCDKFIVNHAYINICLIVYNRYWLLLSVSETNTEIGKQTINNKVCMIFYWPEFPVDYGSNKD